MNFQLVYFHLTLAQGVVELFSLGRGHAQFDNEYLGNGDRLCTNYYCHQRASHILAFDWRNYISSWQIVTVRVKVISTMTINIDNDYL